MAANPSSKQDSNSKSDEFVPRSTFLESAKWDRKSQVMILTFKTGSQYQYQSISESIWLSFKQSPDHSSYYSRGLKGRSVSVPIAKKVVGIKKSTPLQQNKLNRSLSTNGNITDNGLKRDLKRRGLIPEHFGRAS